jgi:hypothetical protein
MDFVHVGNHKWNLVLYMLFGIRQSVISVRYEDSLFQLHESDYTAKIIYPFDSLQDKKSSDHYLFYDYCPRVFHLVRKFFGIKSDLYL